VRQTGSIPSLVIAGTHSGAGKTTVTVGLCGALRRLGLRVAVFKCGPDYLDPTWHFRAAGVRSQTLDGWMMGREAVLETFQSATQDADVALIEGVMGLFDGVEAASDAGSTAEIAKWLNAPVLLVVDAAGMSRSVAALAGGFADFDRALQIGGLICNRVGSRRHLDLLRQAGSVVPVLGGLPRSAESAFPERHLGLYAAEDAAVDGGVFAAWAGLITEWCDLEKIMALARSASTHFTSELTVGPETPGGPRIGIARDAAFHFYYDENLRLLRRAGAELVEFSPLQDKRLPELDGLYLGGGYPEVHARALAENESLRRHVYEFCASGKPVYAECGGLMYLCAGIRQRDGSRYPMAGWFDADAVMAERLRALGYVEAQTKRASILGPAGLFFRGHEFRYSTLEWKADVARAYTVTTRRNGDVAEEGYARANVLGSYVHAHWASNREIPEHFVKACAVR
jgi:cobyrinic acid a,c-diamide synthase